MEADQQLLLDRTLRELVAAYDADALTEQLASFGFVDLLAEAPADAVPPVFHAMGRAGGRSGALQDVLRASLPAELVDEAGCDVVLPAFGQHVTAELASTAVTGHAYFLGAAEPDEFLAVMQADGKLVWTRSRVGHGAQVRAVQGLDPSLGLLELQWAGVSPTVVLAGPVAEAGWDNVVAAGRRALAHQILGAVERMLELAVQHALERRQFGRQIGSFQAVRHRLADAYVAKEAAAAAAELAWQADDEVLAAMLAKSLAGRAARVCATQCQQVLAGIGFTAEHPFHHYLKRVTLLDRILGSSSELTAAIGARLTGRRQLPRLVEL
jgi:hypothetical protein